METPRVRTVGTYRLVRKLGQGGMSAVYLAESESGQRVALKLMSFLLEDEPELLTRFRREATVTLTLDHPNIVKTLEFGEEADKGLFLVMELIEGENLRQRLMREGKLSPVDARALTYQMVEALAYAHERGVVHRDLKPENLLLDASSNLKVADFGVARVEEGTRLTRTGVLPGTPEYMSPEQLTEGPVGVAMDIYGMAIVVYEMLTGSTPFRSENLARVIQRQVYEEPEPPSKRNSDLNQAVDRVLIKALSKDPAKRQETVRQFYHEFEEAWRVQDPEPAVAAGLNTVYVTWSPPVKRRPWWHWLLPWSLTAAATAVWLWPPAAAEPLWLQEGLGFQAVPVGGSLHGALLWEGVEIAVFAPERQSSGVDRAREAGNRISKRLREGTLNRPDQLIGEIQGDDYVLRDAQELVRITPALAASLGADRKQVGQYWLALWKDVLLLRLGKTPRYAKELERERPLRLDSSQVRAPVLDRLQQRARLLVPEGALPTSSVLDALASLPREDRDLLSEAARVIPLPLPGKKP